MLASLLQPVLEGVLTFLRRNAGQQMGYLNIFVQIGPVNAFTVADEMPVCPLFGGTMQQPEEPGQWNANGAVVFQRDDQFFVGNLYFLSPAVQHCFQLQATSCCWRRAWRLRSWGSR